MEIKIFGIKLSTGYKKYMYVMGIVGQLLYYLQGIKIFYEKSAKDVSFSAFLLGFIAVSSWLIYGFVIKDKILIVSNAVAVVGALFVLLGIIIY